MLVVFWKTRMPRQMWAVEIWLTGVRREKETSENWATGRLCDNLAKNLVWVPVISVHVQGTRVRLDSKAMDSFAWWEKSEESLAFSLGNIYWLLLLFRSPVRNSTNEAKEDRCVSLAGKGMNLKVYKRQIQRKQQYLLKDISNIKEKPCALY